MFGPPPDHVPTPTERDLTERWQVTTPTRMIAVAMIAAYRAHHPDAAHVRPDFPKVYIGLALPGKTYGVWEFGQPVEEAPGFWLATDTTSARFARDAADAAAGTHLAGRAGTTSYALVWDDEHCAVFEGLTVPAARSDPTHRGDDAPCPCGRAHTAGEHGYDPDAV